MEVKGTWILTRTSIEEKRYFNFLLYLDKSRFYKDLENFILSLSPSNSVLSCDLAFALSNL